MSKPFAYSGLAVVQLQEQLGSHARDNTTGVSGRITAVCFNESESAQFRLARYGVDAQGAVFPPVWAYCGHCVPCSYDEARGK